MAAKSLAPPTPEQIRALRERAGLTRVQAAELVHVSPYTWRNWEQDVASSEHRTMPLTAWALFKLLAG